MEPSTSATNHCADLNEAISKCLLRRLAKNYDDNTDHAEYIIRNQNLDCNLQYLIRALEAANKDLNLDILTSLFILFYELRTKGDWNTEICASYSTKLESYVIRTYKTNPIGILQSESHISAQDVFDMCLDKLNTKLTPDNFKKYPSLIDVYHELLIGLKDYKVKVNAPKALAVSLNLIGDHIEENKIKGLECCNVILSVLKPNDFKTGNYYEVIHQALYGTLRDKSEKITKLSCSCLLSLIKLLPIDIKTKKYDSLNSVLIEELTMESNFYRKRELFEYLQILISIHGVNCAVKKKTFLKIVIDNFNNCKVHDVKEIILPITLQCVEEWIKHCWCTWCYQRDRRLLSSLFLILYILNEKEEKYIKQVQIIIITLLSISLPEQKEEAIKQMKECKLFNSYYEMRMKYIENELNCNQVCENKVTTV